MRVLVTVDERPVTSSRRPHPHGRSTSSQASTNPSSPACSRAVCSGGLCTAQTTGTELADVRLDPHGRTAAAKSHIALAPALLVASRRRRPFRPPRPAMGSCAALTLENSRPGRHNAPSRLRAQGRADVHLDLRWSVPSSATDDVQPAALSSSSASDQGEVDKL
ncbi:hypothetical protein WME94_44745 [Sorangium sp. So ce429]